MRSTIELIVEENNKFIVKIYLEKQEFATENEAFNFITDFLSRQLSNKLTRNNQTINN